MAELNIKTRSETISVGGKTPPGPHGHHLSLVASNRLSRPASDIVNADDSHEQFIILIEHLAV